MGLDIAFLSAIDWMEPVTPASWFRQTRRSWHWVIGRSHVCNWLLLYWNHVCQAARQNWHLGPPCPRPLERTNKGVQERQFYTEVTLARRTARNWIWGLPGPPPRRNPKRLPEAFWLYWKNVSRWKTALNFSLVGKSGRISRHPNKPGYKTVGKMIPLTFSLNFFLKTGETFRRTSFWLRIEWLMKFPKNAITNPKMKLKKKSWLNSRPESLGKEP